MKYILKKRRSQALRAQALRQYRETRDAILRDHPDLLDDMKVKIEAAQASTPSPQKTAPPKPKERAPEVTKNNEVKIDKSKNLETIIKFIEAHPDKNRLKQSLSDIL